MKGVINKGIQKMIEVRYGVNAWHAILEKNCVRNNHDHCIMEVKFL